MLRNRVLMAVSFIVFAAYVGSKMVLPVRVLYAQAHGASLAIIGAMATAFLVSNFIFQYPMGWVGDRWGRKRIMVAGLILQMAVSLLTSLFPIRCYSSLCGSRRGRERHDAAIRQGAHRRHDSA